MEFSIPISLLITLFSLLIIVLSGMGIVFLERRIAGFFQDRLGPNRVGPFGTFQIIADAVKLLFKEDYTPAFVSRLFFYVAPPIAFLIPVINFVIIPFSSLDGSAFQSLVGVDINVGILFFLAMGSLTTYSMTYGAWAANSKFPIIGGMRSSAQMISFEIAMGLSLISLVMTAGSITPRGLIEYQIEYGWFIYMQPLAFIIFMVTAFAETNRTPFDLSEAEQELVGGYHTEYSSLRFGFYMIGEWMAVVTMSAFVVLFFLGSWYVPYLTEWFNTFGSIWIATLLNFFVFMVKLAMVCFFFIWTRWTLLRVKWHQLMRLGWQVLIPLALANIVLTALWLYFT
jgi:NADH-quinone oxidoreductase subunit H